jgi:hypothetical protein
MFSVNILNVVVLLVGLRISVHTHALSMYAVATGTVGTRVVDINKCCEYL